MWSAYSLHSFSKHYINVFFSELGHSTANYAFLLARCQIYLQYQEKLRSYSKFWNHFKSEFLDGFEPASLSGVQTSSDHFEAASLSMVQTLSDCFEAARLSVVQTS